MASESNDTDSSAVQPTKQPLARSIKVAFGVGQIAEGIQAAVFLTFLLFFYNQVLGLSGALSGLALAISLMFDAVTDPLLGNLSDAWHSKHGRRHPFMYVAALPLGFFFFLLFNPLVSGEWPLFWWLLTMTVCCRGAMTLYHVPHSALGAELSEDFHERTELVAWRHSFGAVAFIGVFLLGFLVYFVPTADYPNGQLNPGAYGGFTGWLAIAMVLSVWYSAVGTRSRIPYLPKASSTQRFTFRAVVTDTLLAIQNPSFRSLIIGFAIIIVAFGAAGALGLYMLTFFWALEPWAILLALLAGPLGSIVGYATSKRLFDRLDKKVGVLVGASIWIGAHGSVVPLYLLGIFPPPGSVGILLVVSAFGAVGAIGIAYLLVGMGTMLADIADQHELSSDQRNEGIFFGAFSLTNKSSAALGSLIGGSALDLLNWPTGSAIRSAADIPADVLVNLGLTWGPLALLMALPGFWFLNSYRLDREAHAEILSELHARRLAVADASTLEK